MKFWLLIFFAGIAANAFAQEKALEGIVFDKSSNERIARVNIVNQRTKQSIYNNLKAEFKLNALPGDVLIVSKQDYYSDTLKVPAGNILLVYLKPSATLLKQVNIRDTMKSPLQRYLATKSEYSKAYGSNAYRDVLTLTPGLGAGISIDALWNSFSREGRNAARLQEVIERDYRESEIDYRFNKTLVANITGLKEPELTDFMHKYRPSYYSVQSESQYEFVASIRLSLKRYLRNQGAFGLQALDGVPTPSTLSEKSKP